MLFRSFRRNRGADDGPPPQGTPGQFLSAETVDGLTLAAIINGGNTKVYASRPPTQVSAYMAKFPGGLTVRAKGESQMVSGGSGVTKVQAISPGATTSLL